jgi:hypothetical protein
MRSAARPDPSQTWIMIHLNRRLTCGRDSRGPGCIILPTNKRSTPFRNSLCTDQFELWYPFKMSKALSSVIEFQHGKSSKRSVQEILIFLLVLTVCALAYKFMPTEVIPESLPAAKEVVETASTDRVIEHTMVQADVQMALILDTSASMDGLIRQAREQILEIVTDLQKDENGKTRTLALALYRYGTDEAPQERGYIQCLVPLTTDHESIVEALGWLQAGGSEEYAPMAISTAVEELAWNPDPSIPKVIVIVGNETFAAGPKGTQAAFDLAESKKIRVLPIYCVGQHASTSAVSGWRRAAHLAGTNLEMIDPNLVVEALEKPIDKEVYNKLAEEAKKNEDKKQNVEEHPPLTPDRVPRPTHYPGYQKPMYEVPAYKKSTNEIPAYKLSTKEASAAPRAADFSGGVRRGMKGVLKGY